MNYQLLHHPLEPFSRLVRLALLEMQLPHELVYAEPWAESENLTELNPAGTLPILRVYDLAEQHTIAPASAIIEYLADTHQPPTYTGPDLRGATAIQRAEVRRLLAYWGEKFYSEVTLGIWFEKVYKKLAGLGEPDSQQIRASFAARDEQLGYLAWLVERRNWLAGDQLSLADLAAAAQISVLDYTGDIPWYQHEEVKSWYSRIKSRPSFRPLLMDRVSGLIPAGHYPQLDF